MPYLNTGRLRLAGFLGAAMLTGRPGSVAHARSVGAFPLPGNSADAVLLSTVNPLMYSVHVTGSGGTTGVARAERVELYEVP